MIWIEIFCSHSKSNNDTINSSLYEGFLDSAFNNFSEHKICNEGGIISKTCGQISFFFLIDSNIWSHNFVKMISVNESSSAIKKLIASEISFSVLGLILELECSNLHFNINKHLYLYIYCQTFWNVQFFFFFFFFYFFFF